MKMILFWLVRGSLGALGYVKDENIDWNINSQLAVIRTDKSELSGKFLVQFLLSWRGQKELLSRNTGTALKQLPIKQLKDVPVPIVNLDEQKEIGALFSSIDNLIAATQDKLSFLKKMKMFFLQQIFPTKDHDVPQIRFDGFTDAWSHYKLGSLMRIDKEQEVKKELLTDIQKGFYVLAMRTFSMDGYIDHSKPYWLNHLDNVSDDKFLLPREFAILDADMDANLPKIGRVLLNASSEKYLLAAHVRKIQVKSGNDPIFIYALMRGNSVHERLKLEANGSISKRLLDKNVYKQSILVPNRSEQSKIGRLFFLLETTITLHQQKIQMLKQVKKSCLQNLFI
ncbi:type I R/M system specificity subunit [Lacticaseibacillus paracasei subsp. paracasei Lpp14]|uniref:Type I R/M system specificity subunit n=1 Tax=Lacticaseibacillus paracasei subsp. paracasei Lpp14 TaxID=1256204 RepID=A0A829H1Z1_LACPA|nr:type I R/M system specificity subunit [Lacticaseibacillus paracasei subsp. paracasei Lpp14]